MNYTTLGNDTLYCFTGIESNNDSVNSLTPRLYRPQGKEIYTSTFQ